MKINKHMVMQEWVSSFLEENYLYFQRADALPNIRSLVPQYGDYEARKDILGNSYKSYTFAFIGFEQTDVGTSDMNTMNMNLFDKFNEWLYEQNELKNFPDFGDNCFDYDIQPLQNMANLASVDETGLAKYMLTARINYVEKEN